MNRAKLVGGASLIAIALTLSVPALADQDVTLDQDVDGNSSDSLEDLKKFLRRIDGQTPVVAYSAIENPFEMAHVLRLGCRGFIPKSAAPSAFVHAIDLVLKGETYIPSKAVECFTVWDFGHRESGVQKRMDSLTPRQRDVLQLLSGGRSNKEIGRELNMLEGTVKVHVKAILRSLKVQNRTQAAVLGAGHYPGRGNI